MRKAFLVIKVLLLLSAFVGTGSTHAGKSDHFGFLDATGFDLTANSEQSSSSDDERPESDEVSVQLLTFFPDSPLHYSFVLVQRIASKPFARGPPVTLSA
jgi:hypothetical protein